MTSWNFIFQWLTEVTAQTIGWILFLHWLSEITAQLIGGNSIYYDKKEITAQLIGRNLLYNEIKLLMAEEWTTDEEWSRKCYRNVTEVPQLRFFFFFLLLLTNFSENLSIYHAGPSPQPPSRLYIGNKGRRLHSSSPRRAACFLQK